MDHSAYLGAALAVLNVLLLAGALTTLLWILLDARKDRREHQVKTPVRRRHA